MFHGLQSKDPRATEQETGGSPGTFRVRQVTSPSEVALMLEWAAAEGWHPGLYDAESFYRQDPTGFYLAELNGMPVGGALLVKYRKNLAFLGNLIIKPAFRGKGYARRMIKTMIESSGMSDGNIGLHSVTHLQDVYNRMFGAKFASKNTRFRGVGTKNINGVNQDGNPAAIVSVKGVGFEHLCEFDASVFGTPRPSFLKSWISQPGMVALAAVTATPVDEDDEHNQETRIAGYGCIRLSVESYKDVSFPRKIGPIFAKSAAVGSQLFADLVATVPPGVSFYIDVPEANQSAMELARESGLESVFQTARMFTKGDEGVKWSMVYGGTTLELG